MAHTDGLKKKYAVVHANGKPADPNGMYFAIKLNSDKPEHARAAQAAALVYAEFVAEECPELAADLRTAVMQLRRDGESSLWKGRCQMVPLPNLYQRALDVIANGLSAGDEMSALAQDVLDGKSEMLELAEEMRDSTFAAS